MIDRGLRPAGPNYRTAFRYGPFAVSRTGSAKAEITDTSFILVDLYSDSCHNVVNHGLLVRDKLVRMVMWLLIPDGIWR